MKPATCGKLTNEEIDDLEAGDIVLLQDSRFDDLWYVGDVVTLSMADLNLSEWDVYNVKSFNLASRSAHKRWIADNFMSWTVGGAG